MSESDIHLVRERRASIARMRKVLDEEDHDLAITERTLARLQAAKTAAKPTGNGAGRPKASGDLTQTDMIVGALRGSANTWLSSSSELHGLIEAIHGVSINKNSFYPLLHDLDERGIIVRENGRIALAERVTDDIVAEERREAAE